MEGSIRNWIFTIIIFVLVMSFLQQLVAGKKYEKYVRFYIGLILIIVVVSPLVSLFNGNDLFELSFMEENFKQAVGEASMEAEQFQELKEERVSGQYESQIQLALEKLINEEGYELIQGNIILEDDTESKEYMYPTEIQARVKLQTEQDEMQNMETTGNETKSDIAVEIEDVIPIEDIDIEGTLSQFLSDADKQSAKSPEIQKLEEKIADFFEMEKEAVQIEMD